MAEVALITSEHLNCEIFVAERTGWLPTKSNGNPVYYAIELTILTNKTMQELQSINRVKLVFAGSKVIS